MKIKKKILFLFSKFKDGSFANSPNHTVLVTKTFLSASRVRWNISRQRL